MRVLWLFSLFTYLALAQLEGTAPRLGRHPEQDFPLANPGVPLLKRAAFAKPEPQATCPVNYKTCSVGCILSDYSCCSNGKSCPPNYYCGSSGGCCPSGQVCSGLSNVCADGTKSCSGTCIPNAESCSTSAAVSTLATGTSTTTKTTNTRTATISSSGGASTSPAQSGDSYTTSDGTCVSGFKLCGTYWCILSDASCCGQFSCRAGSHCLTTTCADTCTTGEKQCGAGCILSSEDCCGDDGSSCDAGYYCSTGRCYSKQSTTTYTSKRSVAITRLVGPEI